MSVPVMALFIVTLPLSARALCEEGFVEISSITAYVNNGSNLTQNELDCLPEALECLPRNTTVSCDNSIFHCKASTQTPYNFFHIKSPRNCDFAENRLCAVPGSCQMSYVVIAPLIFTYERYKWVPVTIVAFILLSLAGVYLFLYFVYDDKEPAMDIV